ncbi:S-adenosyl-L-methionine-dependent methyltransferase [Mariannaea sp. PMI_226]|nr:S-adenosyl-L-methionine-dependent methyltransferase [Mariannaea sp. PMI_226]
MVLPSHLFHNYHFHHGDDNDEDEDSNIANSNARNDNSTTLLAPDILKYRIIHGRTYHAESGTAQYWASNDERQNTSMDMIHHFLKMVLDNELFLAPIRDDIETALDVGTGTGIWAIDFADRFPSTEVTGTDISPIQPSWVPPNLQFEIEDCTQPWTFEPQSMDYVHMRYLYGSISNWTELFREAYNVCKPGGWVESCEASPLMESDDGTVPKNSAMHQWGPLFIDGAKEMGSTFTVVDDDLQVHSMQEVGFEDIKVTEKKIPIGGWANDTKLHQIGRFVQMSLEEDIEGYIQYMAGLLGWSDDQVTVYCAKLRNEIRSGHHHAWFRYKVVYGRRPYEDGCESERERESEHESERGHQHEDEAVCRYDN